MVSRKIGIYRIVNKINSKCYVGKSESNIEARINQHLKLLRNDSHRNRSGLRDKLQNAWNKYGEDNFYWEVVEECKKELCSEREKYYINEVYNSYNNGYNQTRGGDGTSGGHWKLSEYTKNKMRKEKSITHRKNISKKLIGNSNPSGTVRSISTRNKMSENHVGFLGKRHSDESKKKQSSTNLGRVWINNQNGITKFVKSEDINYYINCGWKLGRK